MSDMSQVSDGYHTFAELYEYRMLYNALAANAMPDKAMKCWRHSPTMTDRCWHAWSSYDDDGTVP